MPKLCDLLERPGLEGVKGDGEEGIVAVFGREEIAGEEVVIGEGRSRVVWFSFRAACPPPTAPVMIAAGRSRAWALINDMSFTVAASLTACIEEGDIMVPVSIINSDSCLSLLSLRTTCGLIRPSFSFILRSGVGIDSKPLLEDGDRTLTLLLL